jgi:hypothetical protein
VTITVPKISVARGKAVAAAGAVITAGALIGAWAAPTPGPATPTGKRVVKAAAIPSGLSTAHGTKICDDLNSWLTGAWHEAKPLFTNQMEFDEAEAGYTNLGNDLMTLDWNLVNFNSGALKNSRPNYYPVTGLAALQHDCARYRVTIKGTSG